MSNVDIPPSWVDVCLGDLCVGFQYGINASSTSTGQYRLLRITDLEDSGINWDTVPSCKASEEEAQKYLLKDGDIVIARSGSIGKTAIVNNPPPNAIFASYLIRLRLKDGVKNWPLLFAYFDSPLFQNHIISQAKGATQKNVNTEALKDSPFVVAPVEEQRRIAIKIESTLSKVREIESCSTRVEKLIGKYREALLQKAFRGELTLQNPNDESASELLKRIQVERTEQSYTKRKKQDASPPIKLEEIPFEIPLNWTWARFGDVVKMMRGRFSIRPRNDPSCFGGKYPFVQIGSLDRAGSLVTDSKQSLNEKGFRASKLFPKDTIMIAIVGGTIGNLGVLGREMCFPDSMIGIVPSDLYDQEFILNFLRYKQKDIRQASYQLAGQPNIKLPTLENLLIPMPPLSEQQRIVEALETQRNFAEQINTVDTIDFCNKTAGSIMRKAFEGQLVPQVENEGTGQQLLEEINKSSKSDDQVRSIEKKTIRKRRAKGKSK